MLLKRLLTRFFCINQDMIWIEYTQRLTQCKLTKADMVEPKGL